MFLYNHFFPESRLLQNQKFPGAYYSMIKSPLKSVILSNRELSANLSTHSNVCHQNVIKNLKIIMGNRNGLN